MDEVVVSWALLEISKREKVVADGGRMKVGGFAGI